MQTTKINGALLEYEIKGSGEPLLLISTGPLADGFLPFLSENALSGQYRMITYHQRGQVGSARSAGAQAVSFEDHAADGAALLRHLGIPRAHVAGHSTGAAIALQLAVAQPDLVHTLLLLEPPLTSARSAGAFFEKAGPSVAAYRSGDRERAMSQFLSVVSGLDWQTCRSVLEKSVPGAVLQAVNDADTFFGSYLVALGQWKFGPQQAATIAQPVLSVVGTETEPWFAEGHEMLHSWFPRIEDCKVDGVGHLLHMQRQEPMLANVAGWLARHPMATA
jgi:pimeloyl-ACP methyl ester carboxylesterase